MPERERPPVQVSPVLVPGAGELLAGGGPPRRRWALPAVLLLVIVSLLGWAVAGLRHRPPPPAAVVPLRIEQVSVSFRRAGTGLLYVAGVLATGRTGQLRIGSVTVEAGGRTLAAARPAPGLVPPQARFPVEVPVPLDCRTLPSPVPQLHLRVETGTGAGRRVVEHLVDQDQTRLQAFAACDLPDPAVLPSLALQLARVAPRSLALSLQASAGPGEAFELRALRSPGLALTPAPPLPAAVPRGASLLLTVTLTVVDCSSLPSAPGAVRAEVRRVDGSRVLPVTVQSLGYDAALPGAGYAAAVRALVARACTE